MKAIGSLALRSRGLLLPVALLWALSGCSGPQVVAGNERTVTIKAGPIGNIDSFARNYCRKYGKRAVSLGGGRASPNSYESFHSYDCVEDSQ
jgi:hypothetical protein